MRKTRKFALGIILLLSICIVAACLCACSNGTNGLDGANGKDGASGKSAYEIWLDEGHSGSQADFLNWLKGSDGTSGENGNKGDKGDNGNDGKSAYQIFKEQYPYYQGTEEQWLIALVNGGLRIHTITFQSEVADNITKYVLDGYALTDIPEVPEKEGQTSAKWSVTDFKKITQDTVVTAVYDMRKYVTFHNEFTDDEDITITVNYGDAITEIPQITEKAYNDGKWSVNDFDHVYEDILVEAVYETQGLQFTAINQQTQYRVARGEMNTDTEELFIPAKHNGKPVTVIDERAFGYDNYENRLKIKFVYIPNGITEIRNSAFEGCSLKKVYIPNSLTNYGDNAFGYYYSSITDAVIDLTVIPRDIYHLLHNSIVNLTLGEHVQEIEVIEMQYNIFYNPLLYRSDLNIKVSPNNKFYKIAGGCLVDIVNKTIVRGNNNSVIPDNGSITKISSAAFHGCSELTTVTIPSGVTEIGNGAFYGCSGLTNITIPSSVTEIGDSAFYGCSELTTVTIPSGVTEIGDSVFYGCSGLTNITIPSSVTKIGDVAFADCTGLTSIIIPKSVVQIGGSVFYACNKLEYVCYGGSKSEFDRISIDDDVNTSLPESTVICYYSEVKPTDDGFYWHYDTDGKTPVIWIKEN